MLKPIRRDKKSFTYKNMGFTWYLEQYINHVDFKVLSNMDSEIIYHDEFKKLASIEYIPDDVFLELDNYVRNNLTELEKLYHRIYKWGNEI